MFIEKPLKRWFLIAVAILLVLSSITISPVGEADPASERSLSRAAEFGRFFEVDISPDISDGVKPGQDVVVTVRGREQADGSRVRIEGDKYTNPNMDDRPVPAKINVTNYLWDGTPWYNKTIDNTVWRRNDTSEKFYQRVSPHEVELTIWSEVPGGDGYQFPPGCDVVFNLYVGNKTQDGDEWVNRYLESERYTYEVGGAWPDKPGDYENPKDPDENLFEENIDLTQEPEEPNIKEDVEVNITSRSKVNISRASLYLEADYSDAESPPESEKDEYQYFFDPVNESWPSKSATVTIPGDEWHTAAGTDIFYYVDARDPHGNQVPVADQDEYPKGDMYSYSVKSVGKWEYPDDFASNIQLTTDPESIIDDRVPNEVPKTTGVEVTIESRYETVPIENAYLYTRVSNTSHGVPQEGQWRMEQISSTEWTSEISAQNRGVNVDFYVKAWDISETMIESEIYSYTIAKKDTPPPEGKTRFDILIYDAETGQYVPDVEVGIGNHSWETTTYTGGDGRCFPNTTRGNWKLVSTGEPYWIEVYYPYETGNETKDMVRIEYIPEDSNDRNETEVIYDEGNLVVTRKNDTLEFEYNTPPEPPEYAEIYQGYNMYTLISIFVVVGMAVPVGWKIYVLTEEGKKERSLVK